MAGNTLISPTIVRKIKLILNYGLLISIGYILLTLNIDTRLIHFEIRDPQINIRFIIHIFIKII